MANLHTEPVGAGGKIAYFFRQTFRRHTHAEYSELLTRGMRGAKGINRKYPWAYLRLFTLLFGLFAVYLLLVRFTYNELFAPTITMVAGLCFNLSFLLLIYELYPEKDLSFMSVLLAMLLGGAGANVISQILYNIFPVDNQWLKAVLSGVFEELPKGAAAVIIIVCTKKRSPLAGFVFGAAVGCGFSIAEDMGYVFLQYNQLPSINLAAIITVAVPRGISSLCTHILWTAAIGWAYNLFNKFISNIVFWLITLLSLCLHVAWDLPLSTLGTGLVYAGCAIIALTESALILAKGRNKVFFTEKDEEEKGSGEQLSFLAEGEGAAQPAHSAAAEGKYFEEDTISVNKSHYKYWRHWGHLACAIAAFLMSVGGVLYCCIPFRETYGTETFKTAEEFVYFMQDGLDLEAEENRTYDPDIKSKDIINPENKDHVIQVVEDGHGGYTYYYEYLVSHSYTLDRDYYFPTRVWVEVEKEGGILVPSYKEDLYYEGRPYASFFRVTDAEVSGYNFRADSRFENITLTVYIYDPDFVRNLSDWRYVSLFVAFGAIAGAGVVCYISFKIKSWRIKKLCSTTTASSAK